MGVAGPVLGVLHVVGASVWLGSWVCIVVFAANAVRTPSAEAIGRFFTVMRSLGPVAIGPATLLVLGAGIALVALYPGVAWSDTWIVVGMVLYLVVTLVGVAFLSRYSGRVRAALAADDLDTAVAHTRTWLYGATVVAVLLLLATAEMVLRP